MHRDVDKILDEIIEKKRKSGYGIIWEELFREDYKKAYEEAKQIRKEVAINLLEEGWTVEKIAMVLQEDVKTVRKWLQQT